MRHDFKTDSPDTIRKASFTFDKEREAEKAHRERDKAFVRELAKAFQRGDHLPKGTVPELRLIG